MDFFSKTLSNNLNSEFYNKNLVLNLSNNKLNHDKICIYRNLPVPLIYQKALEKGCVLSDKGALVAYSGYKTGRSAKDKRFVLNDELEKLIWIKNAPNSVISLSDYNLNKSLALGYLNQCQELYVFDGYGGWDLDNRIKIRVITSNPYHALFSNNIFIRPSLKDLEDFTPDYVIYNAGKCFNNHLSKTAPSKTNVMINLEEKEIFILGTEYAGEMKKIVFTIFNFLMPQKNILSLHSSVNFNPVTKDVSIFFGLSGTGKTTLSSDPKRILIGDDEHCWTENGVFNIEGGCYAKCINLNKEKEKDIYDAIKYGSVLENVILNKYHVPDYKDGSITQNTRACYPIEHVNNVKIPCIAGHPNHVILLTCDAFGLLPIVSKLTINQALFYFINGYTSKIAGTEVGVVEPEATFSACFGEAFLPLHPLVYAKLLKEKLNKHNTHCWLINTGWVGGGYGKGERCKLSITRKILDNIHNGNLIDSDYETLDLFNLNIPKNCQDIDPVLFHPRKTWDDKELYDKELKNLAGLFNENFKRFEINDQELLDCLPKF